MESFTYDTGLDRLLTVTGPQNLTMNYAANGNFSQKSDVGSVYTYGTTGKPYQLTGIETATGLVSDVEQTIVYTSFEQPSSITESPYQALFTYNADGERAKMEVKQSGSTIKTRWYAGSRYIKETAGGVTKEFTWIGGDAYSAPCLAVTQSGTTTYYYLLRDHLGTITHVTDASGNVVNEYNFDAWGRRRNFTDWSYTVAAQTDILPDRGFTGHEYLPWFKLYNMNGRLYDPVVGRFLEPDPVVQDASSTQNLNKYSYCLNNPLKYTDPSGNRLIPSPEEERWINPYFIGPREWGPVGPGHGNYWSDGFSRSSGGGGSDYSNFWGQLITSTNYLSDGEYKLIGFGLNENNQFSFLFRSPDYINRLEDFNNRMALASASNIGYGASFFGEGDPQGEGGESKEGKWGWGTYLGGTFAPGVGPTVEIGCLVDSKGHTLNYLSFGIAVGAEASVGGGAIVVPYKNFSAQNWLGDGLGASFNIIATPFSLEYAQSMYNTTYRAGKIGVGTGLGGSVNWTYTIVLPVVPPAVWSRPGQPR